MAFFSSSLVSQKRFLLGSLDKFVGKNKKKMFAKQLPFACFGLFGGNDMENSWKTWNIWLKH